MLLRPVTGSRPEARRHSTGTLRLSRHSTITGPYAVDRGTGMETGLPAGMAYLIDAPVERGDGARGPGAGTATGSAGRSRTALPVRDEARVLDWAIAVARRLGGVLRVGPGAGGETWVLLTPDPSAAVDLDGVERAVGSTPRPPSRSWSQVLPRAYLNLSGLPVGRATPRHRRPARGGGPRCSRQSSGPGAPRSGRLRHRSAEEPCAHARVRRVADLALDGMVALEVSGETTLPPVVKSHPWAVHGAVALPGQVGGRGPARPRVRVPLAAAPRSRATGPLLSSRRWRAGSTRRSVE